MSAPSPRPGGFDIVAILQWYGIKARTMSMVNLMAWCPFHNDKKPSLSINLKTGEWYCFGCERHGGIIDFVNEIEGYDNELKALLTAKRISHTERMILPDFNMWDLNTKPDRNIDRFERPPWEKLYSAYENRNYEGCPEYAFFRGLKPQTLKQFDVRWDPQRKHLIFPVKWQGKIIGFQRRVTTKEDEALSVYRSSMGLPRKRILYWTKQWTDDGGYPPLLVEGVIDVLKAWQYGWLHVLHSFGCRLSEIQKEWLKNLQVRYKKLYAAMDHDTEGHDAEKKLIFATIVPKRAWKNKEDVGALTKQEFWQSLRDAGYEEVNNGSKKHA